MEIVKTYLIVPINPFGFSVASGGAVVVSIFAFAFLEYANCILLSGCL